MPFVRQFSHNNYLKECSKLTISNFLSPYRKLFVEYPSGQQEVPGSSPHPSHHEVKTEANTTHSPEAGTASNHLTLDAVFFLYSPPWPRVLIHYFYSMKYSVICRPSDHTVGRRRVEIRTRDV